MAPVSIEKNVLLSVRPTPASALSATRSVDEIVISTVVGTVELMLDTAEVSRYDAPDPSAASWMTILLTLRVLRSTLSLNTATSTTGGLPVRMSALTDVNWGEVLSDSYEVIFTPSIPTTALLRMSSTAP